MAPRGAAHSERRLLVRARSRAARVGLSVHRHGRCRRDLGNADLRLRQPPSDGFGPERAAVVELVCGDDTRGARDLGAGRSGREHGLHQRDKHAAARAAPERYLSHVAEYYHAALGADPAFNGLGRNPAHPDAKVLWGAPRPYTLDQLASILPFNWRRPKVATTGIGRNNDLFRTGLRWAGREANAGLAVLPALHAVNAEVAALHGKPPLPDAEVAGIARSIERYRERWARQGHKPSWLARQAARGRKGGRPRLYEPGREPWVLEGISRASWYRRRRETKANTDIPPLGGPCSPPPSSLPEPRSLAS